MLFERAWGQFPELTWQSVNAVARDLAPPPPGFLGIRNIHTYIYIVIHTYICCLHMLQILQNIHTNKIKTNLTEEEDSRKMWSTTEPHSQTTSVFFLKAQILVSTSSYTFTCFVGKLQTFKCLTVLFC